MGLYRRKKTWYIQYFANGKRRREAIGPSKRQAELVLCKRKAEIREGRYFDIPRIRRFTFEQLANRFVREYARPRYSPHSLHWLTHHLRPALTALGDRNIQDISSGDIGAFLAGLSEGGRKPSTINRHRSQLSSIFSVAVGWHLLALNPVSKVKSLKEEAPPVRYLMPNEAAQLVAACDTLVHPVVSAALLTGMRANELLSLRWENVDFRAGHIQVILTKSRRPRSIPFNESLRELLGGLPRQLRNPLVFTLESGEAIPYRTLTKRFRRAVKAAGLEPFTFHGLRHTFASNLVMSGVDLTTVKELLGHSKFEMTLRYAHLAPSHTRAAMETLGKTLRI